MSSSPTSKRQNPQTAIPLMPSPKQSPPNLAPAQTNSQNALDGQLSASFTSNQASTLQPSAPPQPLKRKMDLNSQLQAAASFNTQGEPSLSAQPSNPVPDAAPPTKKPRTNTPWTAAEEKRLKELRDIGSSWSEIGKAFPNRTEGSVKKHWYKDMHYAEFTEEEKVILFDAIRDYDANKWKFIGNKVGKPAKACEQFAREHFTGKYLDAH